MLKKVLLPTGKDLEVDIILCEKLGYLGARVIAYFQYLYKSNDPLVFEEKWIKISQVELAKRLKCHAVSIHTIIKKLGILNLLNARRLNINGYQGYFYSLNEDQIRIFKKDNINNESNEISNPSLVPVNYKDKFDENAFFVLQRQIEHLTRRMTDLEIWKESSINSIDILRNSLNSITNIYSQNIPENFRSNPILELLNKDSGVFSEDK